jgi:hypothetical protein
MPEPDDSNYPVVEPTVRGLLVQDVDELAEAIGRTLDAIQDVTDQLEPDRPRRVGSRSV